MKPVVTDNFSQNDQRYNEAGCYWQQSNQHFTANFKLPGSTHFLNLAKMRYYC